MVSIEKKGFEVPNPLDVFSTKYHGSLNNPSRANGDLCEQIFARDCNSYVVTEEVFQNLILISNHPESKMCNTDPTCKEGSGGFLEPASPEEQSTSKGQKSSQKSYHCPTDVTRLCFKPDLVSP